MPRTSKPSPRLLAAFHVVFFLMLTVLGAGIVRDGSRAVRERSYDFKYTERTAWAVGSLGEGEVRDEEIRYRGRDAVTFGIGFAAIGTMLLAWAAGLALSLLGRFGLRTPLVVVRAIAVLSLACLAVGCIALMPPWRLHTVTLYLVVAALALAVVLPIPERTRKGVFPAVVALIFLSGTIGFPAFPIFAGLFVFLIAGTGLLVIAPSLRTRVNMWRRQKGTVTAGKVTAPNR